MLLIVNATRGFLEKKKVVAAATRALMTAIGGAATAAIERRKNPAAIATETKPASRSWSDPAATLETVHSIPVAPIYAHNKRAVTCGRRRSACRKNRTVPARTSQKSAKPSGTNTAASSPEL